GLAGERTGRVVEQPCARGATRGGFPRLTRAAGRHGAELLLSWAMEKGYKDQLAEGRDLMGTTLTAGWLEGNRLALANLGDSRAYLLDASGIEQLTVDGDLGSALLAAGVPPEDVREVGPMAKALRDCIGGYTRSPLGGRPT